eukprot:gene29331-biopygen7685
MESTALFKTSHAKFADEFKAFCAKFPEDAQNTMQLFYESVKHNNVSRISFVYERDAAGNHVLLEMRSTVFFFSFASSSRDKIEGLCGEDHRERRLMLASSRIRRCSGHGDFKTATRALLVLLETATPYAVSPVIMRKASKGVARMLQYYNDITTELTLDMDGVACLIASMPTVFLSSALNACGRQVSMGTDKVSPQFHQLYTDMFIRTCNERTQEHCHLVGLVSLFIATRSQSQMLAVIDALSQDGLGNLFRLLAELPAKIPIPCIDVFIHVANECVATAHLPAGVEDLFIRSAIAILLDNETAGATVASISKTMLRVAIAEPAYAQAMATALEPHMAVAPTHKLACDLLLNPCSIHLPDYALRQLGMRQSLHDRVRIVCELITLDVPAEAVLPLTQTLPSHSDGRSASSSRYKFEDQSFEDHIEQSRRLILIDLGDGVHEQESMCVDDALSKDIAGVDAFIRFLWGDKPPTRALALLETLRRQRTQGSGRHAFRLALQQANFAFPAGFGGMLHVLKHAPYPIH